MFEEFNDQLKRPERNDLGNAKELLEVYKADLSVRSLSFAALPEHLNKIIDAVD